MLPGVERKVNDTFIESKVIRELYIPYYGRRRIFIIYGTKVRTDWKVGLVPAIIGGLAIYLVSRAYFNMGVTEVEDDLKVWANRNK